MTIEEQVLEKLRELPPEKQKRSVEFCRVSEAACAGYGQT
jgi:hypothetical protein